MKKPRNVLAAGLLAASGCITVNVNFPAKDVEKAAEVIVDEARSGGDGAASAPEAAPPETSADRARALAAGSGMVLASFPPPQDAKEKEGESDIQLEIDTPVLKGIRESLKKRFPKLEPFYKKGAIGENREGYIEVRDEAGLSLVEKRDLKALVEAENKDRKNLYEEILKANKIDKEHLKDIQALFARQWIEKSQVGWWVQTKEGKWEKKPPPKDKKDAKEKKAA